MGYNVDTSTANDIQALAGKCLAYNILWYVGKLKQPKIKE